MPVLILFGIIALSVVRIGWGGTFSALYVILSWLTFPGVILRQVSLKLLCDVAGIPVHDVRYFAFKNPPGYVLHDKVTRYRDSYLLTIGPFIVNTVFAMAMFAHHCFGGSGIADILYLWVGASFAMHALPGDGEARRLWRWSKSIPAQSPAALAGSPLVVIASFAGRMTKLANLVYAVVTYCVTFCLIAAVLIAGSVAFPGIYTVKVVSSNPGHPQNNSNPNSAVDDLYQDLLDAVYVTYFLSNESYSILSLNDNGKAASAKEWLPLAEAAIRDKDRNAILIKVSGTSHDADTILPANGKCHRWVYQYAVPADNIVYNVSVLDGTLESVKTGVLPDHVWGSGRLKNASPEIVNWTMDSMDAVAIANKKIDISKDGRVPRIAEYTLEKNFDIFYKGELIWRVSYSMNGISIVVDQDSGDARWDF